MIKITFLGTGGGRFNLINQTRQTGGFRIDSNSANIHVDPGPGALVHSVKNKLNPLSLDAIIITHAHVDHSSDADVLIEGMTNYSKEKKGILIGSEFSIKGKEKVVTPYHLSKPSQIYIPEFKQTKTFKTKKGAFKIKFIKTKHDEKSSFGFKLFVDNKTIGYTGDTEYFSTLSKEFLDCDLLIINCLKPSEDGIPDHLKLSEAISLIQKTKPKKAILTHLGTRFKSKNLKKLERQIQKETGIKTTFAKDNQTVSL